VTERLLTARELGEQLGFSAGTIVDWAERCEIPSFKIGGRLRFRQSEVDPWLEERRVASRDALGVTCGRLDRGVG
jgi:excisionase family DNA binding protein